MDVTAYIKELLEQERFVYVPGLGTFLTRKTAGVYNKEQQRFYPPKNSIDFVLEEKQDETLENYISRQKNISPAAARYFIEKFVTQLKLDAVNRNLPVKEVLFPAENELASASEDQKTTTVFNQENFGLPPITLPPIIKQELEPVEKEVENPKDYIENFNNWFSNNLPEVQEEVKPKKRTAFWVSILLLLTVCILGCYALYLYYPDIYSRLISNQQDVTVIQKPAHDITVQQIQDTAKQTVTEDTVQTKAATDTTSAITKTVTAAPSPVKKSVTETPKPVVKETTTTGTFDAADPDLVEKSPYEIIGAAFKTLKGAKKFLHQLQEKGMHAKILKTNGKSILITFGSYQNKETAQAALEKLHTKDPHSEAYIQHYIK